MPPVYGTVGPSHASRLLLRSSRHWYHPKNPPGFQALLNDRRHAAPSMVVRSFSSPSPSQQNKPEEPQRAPTEAISQALHDADPSSNNLLSPVSVPDDPESVLINQHPAASILANSAIVITRQLELMNVMMGFEQANKYIIMDGQGQHIGYMAERDLGMGSMFKRQMFNTRRSFTTHVFDRVGNEVLRFHRPFAWISSRIGIYDPVQPGNYAHSSSRALSPIMAGDLTSTINQDAVRTSPIPLSDMPIIGEAQQQWAPLRRKYNLFVHRQESTRNAPQLTAGEIPLSSTTALQPATPDAPQSGGQFGQFASVDEPFLSWDFSLTTSDSRLLGSVNRNFAGLGRELFTDTGVYALRMDAAGLEKEPSHLISQTGRRAEAAKGPGMTLDQRAVMLATAVSIDFDYFSRHSGGPGFMGGFMPFWFPGAGGAAVGAEAGAEAGALEGAAAEAAEGKAAGRALQGTLEEGTAERAGGAAAGAGGLAGYEAMSRGRGDGGDGSFQGQQPPQPPPNSVGEGEDVWGTGQDPWAGQGGGGGEGGGGGWMDTLGDLFNDE